MNDQPEVDKTEIAESVQRIVERAALHNIRKLAEQVKKDEDRKRRREVRIVIAAVVILAILLVLAGWFLVAQSV